MRAPKTGSVVLLATVLLAAVSGAQPPGERARQGPLVQALDTNHDGRLSASEIEYAAESLRKLDRSQDGELGPDEIGAAARRRPNRFRSRPWFGRSRPAARTLAASAAEKQVLGVLADLETQRRGNMNVPRADGRLLRLLTEACGARTVVEIGTSNGYSGLWICLGLRATGGRLVTHEIDRRRAAMARASFERAGVKALVTLVEGDAHQEVTKLEGPVDLLFIDADKAGDLDYLEKLLPLVRPGGLVLAHNMNRPAPDPAFVKAITTSPGLETLFFHLDDAGMAVALKKRPVSKKP